MEYKQYLQSNKWKKQRNRTKYWHGNRCKLCPEKIIDIHHKTYKRIFDENPKTDLVPLCRDHHFQMHREAKAAGENLWNYTNKVVNKVRKKVRNWSKMSPYEREQFLGKGL